MARPKFLFSSHRTRNLENIKKQRPKFPKLVRDIIRISDIILEVLDARFISETRNPETEKLIASQGKKLIYVLNKADLINREEKNWEVESLKLKPFIFVSCKKKQGIQKLKELIKKEVKNLNSSYKTIHIGIIGYPNTGKSSLINKLTNRNSARTASEAGFTRGMQKIRFAPGILILDTPGVIPESEYSHTQKQAIQKQVKVGARTSEKIRDPEMVVVELMRTNSKEIEKFYKIKSSSNPEVLIEELGRKMNFLKKGNLIDVDRTSKLIIRDWQQGRIRL